MQILKYGKVIRPILGIAFAPEQSVEQVRLFRKVSALHKAVHRCRGMHVTTGLRRFAQHLRLHTVDKEGLTFRLQGG